MTDPVTTQVPAEPKVASVSTSVETPATGTVSTKVETPTQTAADAEALKSQNEKLQAEVEKYRRDVDKTKSVFQRRETEAQRERERLKSDYETELRRVAMAGMDDDEKKAYESELDHQRLTDLQTQVEQLQAEKQTLFARSNAIDFFVMKGVPQTALDLNGSLEELTQSGYDWMEKRIKELESGTSSTKKPEDKPAPVAPSVDTTNSSPASLGPTWADVDKEWKDKGGREAFYQALQNKQIPSDRLPLKKQ